MALHVPCAGYTAFGTLFDGVTNYAVRGAKLTGVIDGKVGSLAARIRVTAADGVLQTYLCGASVVGGGSLRGIRLQRSNTSNAIRLITINSANANILVINTRRTFLNGSVVNLLMSWDQASQDKLRLYTDDESDLVISTPPTDTDIAYSTNTLDWAIGGSPAGTTLSGMCLKEFWFSSAEWIDFSIAANRRMFFDSIGRPVDKGASGELPTGVAPIIYMPRGDGVNFGTGGNFTFNGTRVSC